MDNYHSDGEGYLTEPTDENSMVKEYNDNKAFTGVILVGVALGALLFLSALCYSVATVTMYIIDSVSKH